MIKRPVKFKSFDTLIPKNLPIYESYIEGKMTKRLFITKRLKAKEHFSVYAYGEYEYFIIFNNECSR